MWAWPHAVAHGLRRSDATLGIMPPSSGAVGDELVELVDGRSCRMRLSGSSTSRAEALDVGEVDELLGPERLGDGAGRGVGVDVVGLALDVGADGGDDRDEVLGQQPLEDAGVDVVDVADEAELGRRGRWR